MKNFINHEWSGLKKYLLEVFFEKVILYGLFSDSIKNCIKKLAKNQKIYYYIISNLIK